MHVTPSKWWANPLWIGLTVALVGASLTGPVQASDPENCLLCHRYPGLGRVENGQVQLYHVDADYYDRMQGPHAQLKCTDCHERTEVHVIPHQDIGRVDCTRTCHLNREGHLPVEFSHQFVSRVLTDSIHTREVLDRCNELLGMPLEEDQSSCLLCHSEPTFRAPGEAQYHLETPTARCNRCHQGQLQINVDYAFRHVTARAQPTRSHEELAKSCALCHSNKSVRREFGLNDTIASYLESFHGKAMLLGSTETAGCLDCHVGETENVHLMLARDNPASSAHEGKLPDTCRSAACHPGAGKQVSAAAVHQELTASYLEPLPGETNGNAEQRAVKRNLTIEYLIAIGFVVLIMFTFGPSAILQMLELFQTVVGRHNIKHHQRTELARKLMSQPDSRERLKRFTVHQRMQHWVLFLSFTALVVTGFPIKFAGRPWASWTIDVLGGLTATRIVHRWAGLLLIAGAVYHLIYVMVTVIQSMRRSKVGLVKTVLSLPLVVNVQDVRELLHMVGYLLFLRKTRPAGGRFGLKEKFEYFGVFWGCSLLGVTGVLMWANSWTSLYMGGRAMTLASLVHTLEAFLAILHVGVFHVIGVILQPAVFPLSKAMFTGDTPIAELAEAHAGSLAEVDAIVNKETATESNDGK